MKKKDMYVIFAVALGSAIFSFALSNYLIAPPSNRSAEVEVVQPFSGEFNELSSQYFHSESVNPTRIIKIGDDPNSKPFGSE